MEAAAVGDRAKAEVAAEKAAVERRLEGAVAKAAVEAADAKAKGVSGGGGGIWIMMGIV